MQTAKTDSAKFLLEDFDCLASPYPQVAGETWERTEYCPKGLSGEPVAYSFREDNGITTALLLSFFLMVPVITRSWQFLADYCKDFLQVKERENMFTDRTDTALSGKWLLILQTALLLGVFFTIYAHRQAATLFSEVSPTLLLVGGTLGGALLCFGKILAYQLVNNIFFTGRKVALWTETYLLSLLLLSVLWLPLALSVVYLDLDFHLFTPLLFSALLVVKILLLYRCLCIFFNYLLGYLHLILYFCTLEILPLLIVWRILVFMSSNQAIIFTCITS